MVQNMSKITSLIMVKDLGFVMKNNAGMRKVGARFGSKKNSLFHSGSKFAPSTSTIMNGIRIADMRRQAIILPHWPKSDLFLPSFPIFGLRLIP